MKLRNKLILSCAALAAVATTAVSTTYAWYTSNQEVTATGVEASTSSSADALLLISKTGAKNTWSSSVNLNIDLTSIVPVYRDAAGAVHKWDSANNKPLTSSATAGQAGTAEATTTAGDYISFSLYFKSGNGNPLDVSYKTFTITNTTDGNLPTKSVLTSEGLTANSNVDGEYSVNFVKALTMENVYSVTTEATTGVAAHAQTTGTSAYKFKTNSSKAATTDGQAVNAHTYYNNVKNFVQYEITTDTDLVSGKTYYARSGAGTTESPYTYAPVAEPNVSAIGTYYEAITSIEENYDGSVEYRTAGETTRQEANLTNLNTASFVAGDYTIGGTAGTESASILRVDYIIYLDGWDYFCFDACQGQTFTLEMTFKATEGTI